MLSNSCVIIIVVNVPDIYMYICMYTVFFAVYMWKIVIYYILFAEEHA